MARYSRGASPNARLRGFSDAWRAYLAEASSFRMHGGDMLPRTGTFPVRGPLRERMKRKSRHGSPPGNAPRHNLATTGPPKTHHGDILPWPTARKRIAARSCHCRTPGERISRASCHRRAPEKGTAAKYCHNRQPGDASRRNDATTRPSGMHHGDMLPRQGVSGICGRDMLPLPVRATLARCRDEGAGGARGNHRPLRREWGICVVPVHWYTRRSVFGKWGGHCAACAVPFASWRPHRRGMGSPGSILGGDNRADFHSRGARPFSAA